MSDYFVLKSANGDHTVTRGNPFKLLVNYCCNDTRKNFLARVLQNYGTFYNQVL